MPNNIFMLGCEITNFSGQASWIIDTNMNEKEKTICRPSGNCSFEHDDYYKFFSNASEMFVQFNPLKSKDDGLTWKCYYSGTSVNYTIRK